jgi:hypothetical protein
MPIAHRESEKQAHPLPVGRAVSFDLRRKTLRLGGFLLGLFGR